MHYYIDGYNLLFRFLNSKGNLQSQRNRMIEDLNEKIGLAQIDVTIVFDAFFQTGPHERFRSGEVEILFTNEGQTADEYILDALQYSSKPRQETVVTSDKTLAMHARHFHAHTESVEFFMRHLNRLCDSKQRKSILSHKKTYPVISKEIKSTPYLPKLEKPSLAQAENTVHSVKKSGETSLDYYELIFEARLQEYISEEKQLKKEAPKLSKKARKKISPFDVVSPDIEAKNQMERWLKIFTERVEEE